MAERKPMTREEFESMRQKRWEAMRERAAEMGRELPETPPWEAAEQRRKEWLEKYEAYRAIIEAMTDEQKEAIAALFGGRTADQPMMMRSYPMGGCGKPGPCPQRGMMPYGVGPEMVPGMMPMPPQTGSEQPPTGAEPAPAAPSRPAG
jgi:hypothetical protein